MSYVVLQSPFLNGDYRARATPAQTSGHNSEDGFCYNIARKISTRRTETDVAKLLFHITDAHMKKVIAGPQLTIQRWTLADVLISYRFPPMTVLPHWAGKKNRKLGDATGAATACNPQAHSAGI